MTNNPIEVLSKAIQNEDVGFLCKLNYDVLPTPSQEEIIRNIAFSKYQHQLITSYTQFGKSYCVAMAVGLYILLNENKKIKIISPTYVQSSIVMNYLAEFIVVSDALRSLVEFEATGVEKLKKQVTKSRITFRNGCEVQLLSAEGTAKRLMGFGADLVVLDESCLIDYETYRLRISRMTGANKGAIFVEIGNPFDKLNQFYAHFLDPSYNKIHIDWQKGVEEGRLDINYVNRQRQELMPMEFKILYDALFPDDTEDTLFKSAWIAKAQREPPKMSFAPTKILGIDVARLGNDKTIVWEIEKFEELIVVKKKHTLEKQRLTDTRDDITKIMKVFIPDIINIDSTGMGCITPDTEVWTVNGWKKARELTIKDKVYSKDKNNNLTIESIKSISLLPDTDIIKINAPYNTTYEFSHSHFLPQKTRLKYNYRLDSWDKVSQLKQSYLDNAFNYNVPLVYFKEISNREIPTLPFTKLLAWFISEGNLIKGGIGISQSVKSKHNQEIINSIKESGFNYTLKQQKNGENSYRVWSVDLNKWAKLNCYTDLNRHTADTKKIPNWLKNNSKEIISLFLEAYIKGDGCKHKTQNNFFTSSIVLSDDLLELIYKKGSYGIKRLRNKKGSVSEINGRKITRAFDHYGVTEWKTNKICIRPTNSESYIGDVYNIKITGDTRLFACRFSDYRMFFVHNGGLEDMLKEYIDNNNLYTELNPIIFSASSEDKRDRNKKAEIYRRLSQLFESGKIIIPRDPELIMQLSQIKYELKQDKFCVVDEHLMHSPDEADALAVGCYSIKNKCKILIGDNWV